MGSSSTSGGGGVPPGFRFHPTDEELLHYYLKKKVSFQKFEMEVIRDVDLNKLEPWDLQERCRIGSTPQNEWYFFSHKDRKYPTGSRTNRATNAGFWKATGRDKCIRNSFQKIGMRKTLVFYRGRAPHGQKTDWIMHEYRLEDADHNTNDHDQSHQEEGWVVCRVFKKKNLFKLGGPTNVEAGGGGSSSTTSATNYNLNITNSSTSSDHHHITNGSNHHQVLVSGTGSNGISMQAVAANQYYSLLRQPAGAVGHQYLMMQPSFELNNKPPDSTAHHDNHELGLHSYGAPPHHHQYSAPGLLPSHYQVPPSSSHEVGTASSDYPHHHRQDHDHDHQATPQPLMNDWTMLDRIHVTNATTSATAAHLPDRHDEDAADPGNDQAGVLLPASLSVSLSHHNNNINQLSLGGATTTAGSTAEMDFWGYAK